MNNRTKRVWIAVGIALVSSACVFGNAQANVTEYTDSTAFNALGAIAFDTAFSAGGQAFAYPGDPYAIGGVTYHSGSNVIVGTTSPYHPLVDMLAYDHWSPMTGTVDPGYNLFGFDLAMFGAASDVTLSLATNLGSYSFDLGTPQLAGSGVEFFGFAADPGETVTDFSLSSAQGSGSAPGITNVEVGTAVPEPASLALFGMGIAGLGLVRRRQRQS